jgi:FlaG/FlaF family flagellin (archaellin)
MKTLITSLTITRSFRFAVIVVLAAAFAACAHHGHRGMQHHEAQQALSAANEVPPNTSTASGVGTIHISPDGLVTGNITVAGMAPTAAHIHEAPVGKNGPVIVPFAKVAENAFAPAPGARLTDAQYQSYLAGNLYINVHSATYPGGEIRAQLVPKQ